MENRYDYIDGLKGYASIGVVIYHYILAFASFGFVGWNSGVELVDRKAVYFEYFPYSLLSNTSFLYISIAAIALLPTLNFYRKGNADWIKKEAVVRYFRFLPSIFVCVIITYAFYAFGLFYNVEASNVSGFKWSDIFYTGDMSFLSALKSIFYSVLFEGDATFNTVFWVMQVIFIGSYFSYFSIAFFGKLKRRYIVYIALFLLSMYMPKYSLFLAGIIAGDILSHVDRAKISKYWALFLILGFFFANYPRVILPCEAILNDVFYSLSAFFFILLAAGSNIINKFLRLGFFRYFGRNSFSLILSHSLVLFSISSYGFVEMSKIMPYWLALTLTFLFAIPLNCIATMLFSKLTVKPTRYLCSKLYTFVNGNSFKY